MLEDPITAPPDPSCQETQTQEETQTRPLDDTVQKRRSLGTDPDRPKKKIKISLAEGVDLAE
jgi:hypothetical protein